MLDPKEAYMQTAPIQYENKLNILEEAGEYLSYWGKRILISGGERALNASIKKIEFGLKKSDIEYVVTTFTGECSDENINEIATKAKEFQADIILGVGGGKAIDSAKVAAEKANCYFAAVPTIAATCAAASAFSVVYTSEGSFKRDHFLPSHPVLVMVDPEIIAEAPVKYLKSGIIDGLSKWFEGRAVADGLKDPDLFSQSAMRLAKLLEEETTKRARSAVESCDSNQITDDLMRVINLNIYLTGVIQSLGQKTCRGAGAHGLHNGMTVMPESHSVLHGMKVAYGIIVQLFLENKKKKEINEVVDFMKNLGITPSLKGLGLPNEKSILENVAEKAVVDEVMLRMPIKVEVKDLMEAMEKVEDFV